jgi:hypothetical protein
MRRHVCLLLSSFFTGAVLACSSSSSETTPPKPDASADSSGGKKDTGVDPINTFAVHSSYASFAYQSCFGSGNPDAPYGSIDAGCVGETIGIILTDNDKLTCSTASSGANYVNVPSTKTLLLGLTSPNAFTKGTFPVTTVGGTYAVAGFFGNDSHCHSPAELGAGGTVTITAISDSSASGTYDVKFQNGDRLNGSFDVKECKGATNPAIVSSEADAGACKAL